ncbi:hypothetical protein [Geobacillus sp. WSUCF-018B]|uniref:hypothetical protein n=1 Tax=Geobacillus sp. WSUCF-018B TaxID=2055939 RepID=UPI000C28BCA3|nr:hypothetical protein [Geobacillus sp. WSUCF-018B]PJW18902.1 hypothetical protein CV944_01480 [Geobacillus sp. WSUCF-018B]
MGKFIVIVVVWYLIYRTLGHTPKYPLSCENGGLYDMCDYPEDYRINLFGWIWLFTPIWFPLVMIIIRNWEKWKRKVIACLGFIGISVMVYLSFVDSSPFIFTPTELKEKIGKQVKDAYSNYFEGVKLKGDHYEQVIIQFNPKFDRLKGKKQKEIYDHISLEIVDDLWKKFSQQPKYVDNETRIKGEDQQEVEDHP